MIGEIRDAETAEIAVQSALTGHQVLSTMHCNDAPGAITRLDDMGIAPFLISSSVILACAQRLMRRVCPSCKEVYSPLAEVYEQVGAKPEDFKGSPLYRGVGCDRCKNTGYSGHCAIIEAMTMNDEIRRLAIQRASSAEIGNLAIKHGMTALRDVALRKVREGISTFDQVIDVTAAH
jgi:type IV pilus assembly protein PilB